MKSKKIKIGVTGGIGSGKSLFCKMLAEKNYPVINVDAVSKKILVEDKSVQEKIKGEFGAESFINGEINKKYLAEKVFSQPENVVKINSIVHPKVIKKVSKLVDENFKNSDIVFAEAALIYEADMENIFDYIVLITADEKIRMERKIKNEGYSEIDFIKRNENQIPDEEKKKRADFVFTNNGSTDELKIKAGLLLNIIKGLLSENG